MRTALFMAVSLCAAVSLADVRFRDGCSELSGNPGRGAAPGGWHKLGKSGNEAGFPTGFCSWLWEIGEFSGGNQYGANSIPASIGGEDLPLTDDAIAAVSNTLANARANGAILIVRFGYTSEEEYGAEPSDFGVLVGHVRQLAPVLAAFPEVVQAVECGMIGPWGEMHSSNYREPSHIRALTDAWLDLLPSGTALLVRYPKWILEYADRNVDDFLQEVVDGTYCTAQPRQARLGMFNDGYLGTDTDYGTWRKDSRWMVREQGVAYLEARRNVPYGGELAHLHSDEEIAAINLFDTGQFNIVQEFYRTHLSYLRNIDAKSHLLAEHIESLVLSHVHDFPGMPDLSEWYGTNLRRFMRTHMGYRFVVRGVEFSGGSANVTIENTGFGHLLVKSRGEISVGNASRQVDLDLSDLRPGERRAYVLPLPDGPSDAGPVLLTLRLDTSVAQVVHFANDAMRMGDAVCLRGICRILGGEGNDSNVGSDSDPVSWSDAANWTPSAVPGGSDEVNWAPNKTSSHRHAYVSLDGDYCVGGLSTKYRSLHLYKDGSVQSASLVFTGRLGGSGYQRHTVNSGVALVLAPGSTFTFSEWDSGVSELNVLAGGSAEIYGDVCSRVMRCNVVDGATLVFSPSSYCSVNQDKGEASNHDEINVSGGTASFPRGIDVTANDTSAATAALQQFNQGGGTVVFGGSFTSALPWTYTWSGGTLGIIGDCAFGANVALTIPASATVTLDVADGKTFSVPSFTADSTAVVTKTGGGVFAFAPTEARITVNAGSIGFATSGTYDLSNVSFDSGATPTIELTTFGATLNSLPAALADATFTANLLGVAAGTVILKSSDGTVLQKAQTDLASSVPSGFALTISGTTLSLEKDAGAANTFKKSGDLLTNANWGGGEVPAAGSEVAIAGNGVVATYNGGEVPAWASIEVKDGAKLIIATTATGLPMIKLNKVATLEVADGSSLTLASAADLVGIATEQQVPVLSVVSGATLNVPGGMKFSNVDIDLKGTIAATTEGGIVFGYAAAGDTTYIGLAVDGGTISLKATTSNYDVSPLEFCCPASGGTVVAVRDLMLTGASILPVYVSSGVTYTFTESYKYGFHLGVNNPTTELFEVVFDGTQWGVCGKTIIKGGATFRLVNGGTYKEYETHTLWNRTCEISEMGRVVVGEGCEFRLPAMGNYGNNPLEINPGYAGHQAVVVEDGGVFETYSSSGNGKGVLAVSNGVYQVYLPWSTNASFAVVASNVPFEGLAAVEVADGSTLTFSTRNRVFWNPGQFHDDSGDRVVSLADVPITGNNASVALSNANKNVFGVIVKSGANTATGTASVVAPAEGLGATTLYFANGANWAGTVVAGNVALTNLVDAAAACTNSFGALDLAAEFPFRVWKENGAIVANDVLNVGCYVDNGGRLAPVSATGEAFERGDRIAVGRISKSGASTLPRATRRWLATTEPIDGDDDNDMLVLVCGRAFQVILR